MTQEEKEKLTTNKLEKKIKISQNVYTKQDKKRKQAVVRYRHEFYRHKAKYRMWHVVVMSRLFCSRPDTCYDAHLEISALLRCYTA